MLEEDRQQTCEESMRHQDRDKADSKDRRYQTSHNEVSVGKKIFYAESRNPKTRRRLLC